MTRGRPPATCAARRVVLLLTGAIALGACASARATTPRTAAEAARRDSLERTRSCMLAREDAMRALWLGTMFSPSDPILVGRGPTLGAPAVPRPCATVREDTLRVR